LILRGKKYILIISFAAVTYLHFFCPDSFAAEESSSGRRIWDNIMLFVNFAILVFLFLKFAKKPLIGYLRGVRDKIKNELDTINGRFNDVKSTLDEEANKLKDIDQRIKEIQENAREIAKREKDKIIEDAKIAAEKMIENAKRYHNYRMALAKKALSDEMVDVAISMVEEKLTKKISEEDNEKLINKFFTDLQTLKLNLN